jgi:hypothetical protein
MKTRWLAVLAVPLAVALAGCADDSDPPTGPGPGTTGHVTVRMVDAPAHYDNVNIVITSVQILSGATWVTVRSDSTTYDLMLLRDGVVASLASGNVAVGTYSAVRLGIGASSTVVEHGATYPLQIGMSFYQLGGNFSIAAGDTADVVLDFDVARSISSSGPGQYTLHPTIRIVVNPETTTGRLIGRLLPAGVDATLYAILGTDTVTATYPRSDGRFTFWPLLPDTYQVAVDVETGYRDTVLTGDVQVGVWDDFGDIQLTPE